MKHVFGGMNTFQHFKKILSQFKVHQWPSTPLAPVNFRAGDLEDTEVIHQPLTLIRYLEIIQ